jgi:hypothetical protein
LYLQQIEEIAKHLEKPVSYFLDEEPFLNNDIEISDNTIDHIMIKSIILKNHEIAQLNQFIDYLLWRRNHE